MGFGTHPGIERGAIAKRPVGFDVRDCRLLKPELNITLLYREQGPFIARAIRRLVGEGPHVDDLLQETFIVAYKKRDRFDPQRAAISTWLYGIASNLCRHHERSQRRSWRFKRQWLESGVDGASSQTPGTLLEREQAIHMVHEVLSQLPMKQREAFALYELEGLTGKEISELLHVREGTVWTRIHHARKKFLRQIGRRMGPHD